MKPFNTLGSQPEHSPLYGGGSGASAEDAVIIKISDRLLGVVAEYAFVAKQCGRKGEDWNTQAQALIQDAAGRSYDVLTVILKDGTPRAFYFDISAFYGKR